METCPLCNHWMLHHTEINVGGKRRCQVVNPPSTKEKPTSYLCSCEGPKRKRR